MAKKKLSQCRTADEFIGIAQQRGAEVINGRGSHCKVVTERGMCIIPRHPGDLGKGLRCNILKVLRNILATMLLAGWIYGIWMMGA